MSSEDVISQCPENIAKLVKDIMKQFDPRTAGVNDPIDHRWFNTKFLPSLNQLERDLVNPALDYLISNDVIVEGKSGNGDKWWFLTKNGLGLVLRLQKG